MYTTLEKGFSAQEGYQTLTDHRTSIIEIKDNAGDHDDVDLNQFKRSNDVKSIQNHSNNSKNVGNNNRSMDKKNSNNAAASDIKPVKPLRPPRPASLIAVGNDRPINRDTQGTGNAKKKKPARPLSLIELGTSKSIRPFNYGSRSMSLDNPTSSVIEELKQRCASVSKDLQKSMSTDLERYKPADLKRTNSTDLQGLATATGNDEDKDDVIYFETDEEIYHDPNVFNVQPQDGSEATQSEPFYFQTDYAVDHKKAHRLSSVLRLDNDDDDESNVFDEEDIYMNDDDLTEEDDVTGQEEIYANSPQFTNLPKNEETDFAIV